MGDNVQDTTPSDDEHVTTGPLVSISHDSRDANLAEAFSKLLSSVSAGMLKTFRSSDRKGSQGFEYGVEWYPELIKKIEAACDVVCLLTDRSLERPWILYEAGVAKGKLGIPVHGLALGVPLSKASTGPFAQFQNCDDDTDSLAKLITQLIRRLPHADPDYDTVRTQVGLFNSKVKSILSLQSAVGPDVESSNGDEESTSKLFEEIKVMFQDLPSRLELVTMQPPVSPPKGISMLRRNPQRIERLIEGFSRAGNSLGVSALIVASLFRDDYPWLYEIGAESYRASSAGDSARARRTFHDFVNSVDITVQLSLGRELRSREELRGFLPILLHSPTLSALSGEFDRTSSDGSKLNSQASGERSPETLKSEGIL